MADTNAEKKDSNEENKDNKTEEKENNNEEKNNNTEKKENYTLEELQKRKYAPYGDNEEDDEMVWTLMNLFVGKVSKVLEKKYTNKNTLKHYKDILCCHIIMQRIYTMEQLNNSVPQNKQVVRLITTVTNALWSKLGDQGKYIEEVNKNIRKHYSSDHSCESTCASLKTFIKHMKLHNNDFFIKEHEKTINAVNEYDRMPETKKRILWGIIHSISHIPEADKAVRAYRIRGKGIRKEIEEQISITKKEVLQ